MKLGRHHLYQLSRSATAIPSLVTKNKEAHVEKLPKQVNPKQLKPKLNLFPIS